jgi:hypothetical protein
MLGIEDREVLRDDNDWLDEQHAFVSKLCLLLL